MDQVRAIVLFAKPWRIVDENSGRWERYIEYIMSDNLSGKMKMEARGKGN